MPTSNSIVTSLFSNYSFSFSMFFSNILYRYLSFHHTVTVRIPHYYEMQVNMFSDVQVAWVSIIQCLTKNQKSLIITDTQVSLVLNFNLSHLKYYWKHPLLLKHQFYCEIKYFNESEIPKLYLRWNVHLELYDNYLLVMKTWGLFHVNICLLHSSWTQTIQTNVAQHLTDPSLIMYFLLLSSFG